MVQELVFLFSKCPLIMPQHKNETTTEFNFFLAVIFKLMTYKILPPELSIIKLIYLIIHTSTMRRQNKFKIKENVSFR